MKKIFFLTLMFFFQNDIDAQQWNDALQHTRNLKEIKEYIDGLKEDNKGTSRLEEDDNYHFGRWLYYQENHLDENGNVVSGVKTFDEWINAKRTFSQLQLKTTSNQSQWTFQGPTSSPGGYNGVGRINTIAFHPTDSDTYIIGSAGGGAWRTTDAGLTWTSLYNNLPVLGVSDIDYNPQNPNTIFLCTGDHDGSDTYSVGLLKSVNGGNTWDTTGLKFDVTNFMLIHKLLINAVDTNSLLIATNYNLIKSFDGGHNWVNVAYGNFKDIVYNPTDTNIIYATANGNGNANIFRSVDGGMTWTIVKSFSDGGRIALAVSPIDPATVKAVVAKSSTNGLFGVYNSVDAGQTFSRIFGDDTSCTKNILSSSLNLSFTTCSGQSWYDLCITINPTNANQVLIGGVNTYQSLDGGYTWTRVTQWYNGSPGIKTVHADKHFLGFNPLMQNTLFEGNDGGIYRTTSPSSLIWNDLSNGLGITQFYRNAVANNASFVIGGAQDNGTKRVRFSGAFNELTGGDGMDCQLDYSDSSTFYTSSQYGHINITTDGGNNFTNISNNIPGNPSGAWITPFVIHPIYPQILFAGYDHLFSSTDQGNSWTDISPNFPTSGYQLKRIATTPLNQHMIVVLGGTSTINYTKDYGQNWNGFPTGFSGTISDIAIDPWNEDAIWVTYSGYGNAKVSKYTIGSGWSLQNDSLPNIPVNCIVIDSSNGTKYIGTDVAIYFRDTSMNTWQLYNTGLPCITVNDLGVNYYTNEIWAATFGRGMWKSPRHITQPPVKIETIPFVMDNIVLAPNPNRGSFEIYLKNPFLVKGDIDVSVINYKGEIVFKTEHLIATAGKIQINTSLPQGNYVVEVFKEGLIFAKEKITLY